MSFRQRWNSPSNKAAMAAAAVASGITLGFWFVLLTIGGGRGPATFWILLAAWVVCFGSGYGSALRSMADRQRLEGQRK